MKRILLIVTLFVFLLNCFHKPVIYTGYKKGNIVIVHEKVEKTIEPEEREKYFLFRRISGFKSAIFFEIDGGGFEVEIITENDTLYVVNRDPKAIAILHDYIEQLENIKKKYEDKLWQRYRPWWRWDFKRKWKIRTYDNTGFPITQYEINKYKDIRSCYGGSLGCLAFGLPLSMLMAFSVSEGNLDKATKHSGEGWVVFVGGVCISIVAGAAMSNQNAEIEIIKAIKSERRPRKR